MGRSLIVVAALALLAACGGQKAADPPVSSSPPVSASSSPTALTPPVMPALAKEHTKAGAKAFVVYLWKAIDYATLTSDSKQLERLFAPACGGCNAGLEGIRKRGRAGAKVTGGDETLSSLLVTVANAAGGPQAEATMTITNTEQIVTYPSPAASTTFPANSVAGRVTLRERSDGWYVTELAIG